MTEAEKVREDIHRVGATEQDAVNAVPLMKLLTSSLELFKFRCELRGMSHDEYFRAVRLGTYLMMKNVEASNKEQNP